MYTKQCAEFVGWNTKADGTGTAYKDKGVIKATEITENPELKLYAQWMEKHSVTVDKAVAATCTKEGKTEGNHCSVCNKVLKAQTTIATTGHKWDGGKVDFSATTLVKYGNAWYYVKKGVVDFKTTTLVKYGNSWYYAQKGIVNFKYTGNVNYAGHTYYVKGGVMHKKVK